MHDELPPQASAVTKGRAASCVGRAYAALGNTKRAVQWLESAVPLLTEEGAHTGSGQALFALARLHSKKEDGIDQAKEALHRYSQAGPGFAAELREVSDWLDGQGVEVSQDSSP